MSHALAIRVTMALRRASRIHPLWRATHLMFHHEIGSKTEILKQPSLKVTEIGVETFKGRVQLSGFVSKPEDIEKAVALAWQVKGVKAVNNDMALKNP